MSAGTTGKLSRIKGFIIDSRSFFWQAYILIMAVIYPLYVTAEGYVSIGEDKYLFFKYITLSILIMALIFTLAVLFSMLKEIRSLTVPQLTVFIFIGSAGLSFAFSPYRETAWTGAEGWFMGLMTLLLITAAYFGISRMWKYSGAVWIGFVAGSAIVYILGICNRFSFYPVPFAVTSPEFISTLGNINWFSGYFAVIWPIGACMYLFFGNITGNSVIKAVLGIYMVLAFGVGVTQGSSSVFLSFIAVFYILLLVIMGRWEVYGKKWLQLAAIWCLTCQFIRVIRVVFPGRYNYATDNLCAKVTGSSFSLLLLALVILWYGATKSPKICAVMNSKALKRVLVAIPIAGITLYFLLLAVNTLLPAGIPGLAGNSYFIFDQAWGNARGATWGAGFKLFFRMDLRQKLFGVGPDCFAEYLYSQPDLVAGFGELFNGAVLRNSHNEWLTMLINTGIVGAASYVAIFVAVIVRYIRKGAVRQILYLPAVCAFSYAVHNMVSFGQVLNMPLLFIIMGIGESYDRLAVTLPAGQTMPKEKEEDEEKNRFF